MILFLRTLITQLNTYIYINSRSNMTVHFKTDGWDESTSPARGRWDCEFGPDPTYSHRHTAELLRETPTTTCRLRPTLRSSARGRQRGTVGPSERGVNVAARNSPDLVFCVLSGWVYNVCVDFYQPLILFRSDLDRFNLDFALVWNIDRSGTRIFHPNGWIWILINLN